MKNLRLTFGMLLISGAWIFSSCQKDGMNPFNSADLTSVMDEAFVDNESAKIDEIVNFVAYNTFSDTRDLDDLPECATVTYDTLSTTKKVTVDFGTTPCFCDFDSKYRTGVIIITWSGQMKDPGTVKTINTENYFVGITATELNKFDLAKTITNMGMNANNNLHFAVSVPSGVITLFDGGTITWTADRDLEWTQGASTPDPSDDVVLITGGSSGTDSNGEPFTVTIISPLVNDACEWIVSGIKESIHGNLPPRVIDYGAGTCDDIAVVKSNGNEHIIHLN